MAFSVSSTSNVSSGILTASGVGSGLDVNGLVTKLVAASKAPQQSQIDQQKITAQTQISALGQVTAALTALQSSFSSLTDGSAFNVRQVSSSAITVLSAASSGTPVMGSYGINVSQLATAQKASSGAFADSTTVQVGTGTLTVAVGSKQMSLTIDTTNNTLSGIRDAINQSGANPGVIATIVTGTDGAHLVLSSSNTGVANQFKVTSAGGNGGLAALNYDPAATTGNGLTVITAAVDAKYTIDGLAGSSASNTVTSAIDGLSLNLAGVGSSTVSVAYDSSAASTAVSSFVGAYNSFIGIYNNLTQYSATTNTAGALIGDATLNSIKSTLSNMAGGSFGGTPLSSIGISLQVDGSLQLDSTKLQTALTSGGALLKSVFSGTSGFGTQLGNVLNGYVGSQGILGIRTTNLNQQLTDLTNSQTELNNRMSALTASYQQQFNALDVMLSKLNSTSSFLTQQFNAMSNTGTTGK